MEQLFTGYCRVNDAARTVLLEDGEADCLFDSCPYRAQCTIGQQLLRLQTEGTE